MRHGDRTENDRVFFVPLPDQLPMIFHGRAVLAAADGLAGTLRFNA